MRPGIQRSTLAQKKHLLSAPQLVDHMFAKLKAQNINDSGQRPSIFAHPPFRSQRPVFLSAARFQLIQAKSPRQLIVDSFSLGRQ